MFYAALQDNSYRLSNKISKKRRGSSQSVDNAAPPTESDELDRTGKSKKAQTIQLLEQLRELTFLRAEASRQQPEQARNDKFTRFLSEVTKEFRKLRDIHNAAFQEAFKEEDRLFDTKENARERLFAELQSNYKQMFQDTRAHFVDIATKCLQERERIRHEGQVEMNENYKILRRYLLRRFNEFLAIKAAAVGISESELAVVVMRIGPPPGEPGSYYWSLNSKPHTSVGVVSSCVIIRDILPD